MKIHKNSRLIFSPSMEMIQDMPECCMRIVKTASRHGVTPLTKRKWLRCYLAHGEQRLAGAAL